MAAKIINFTEYKGRDLKRAYNWAAIERKHYGFIAQEWNLDEIGVRFLIDESFKKGKYVAIFYDPESRNAVLRREWDDGYTVQYNVVKNYDELLKRFPKEMARFETNGCSLYERYARGGLNFGI